MWRLLSDIIFAHLTQDNGLPNEIATALAEDGDGFLWVGTLGGLARWDGYRFRVYKSDHVTAVWDGSVGTAAADAIINSTAIQQNARVDCTALTLTENK